MTHESLCNRDWAGSADRLGGPQALAASARDNRALVRARVVKSGVDLLRMILAYCLGEGGLRSTTAWAASVSLVDVSNVALLYRLRQCGDWLAFLVGQAMTSGTPAAAKGRLIRIIDGTTVPKAGKAAKTGNKPWRTHAGFDLPAERFGHVESTGEKGGERLDRIAAIKGEIRIADRAFLQPDRMAAVLDAGADFVVRAGWKTARWLDAGGNRVDLTAELDTATASGLIDRAIWIGRKSGVPLGLRLVAVKKPPRAAEASRGKARREAQKGGHQISKSTLAAAAAVWVIVVTSLDAQAFSTSDVLDLYRLRWRVELAFKRIKSLIALKGPPGTGERSARPYILAHLLMILLLKPLAGAPEDSPRPAQAA